MTRKGGSGSVRPPQHGGLSKEDADLWSRAAQSLQPLRRAKSRVTAGKADQPAVPHAPPPKLTRGPAAGAAAVVPAAKPRTAAVAPPLAGFDQRKLRGIARGRVEIEARVDLHGLRQSEAHHRLRAFVLDAHARGLRSVLVITGKGVRGSPSDEARERGVIRRNVPLWLEEPELRAVVVSFTPAHARHGGEGALYVHLRRRQPAR